MKQALLKYYQDRRQEYNTSINSVKVVSYILEKTKVLSKNIRFRTDNDIKCTDEYS